MCTWVAIGIIGKKRGKIEGRIAPALGMDGADQHALGRHDAGGAQIGARRLGGERQDHAGPGRAQFLQIIVEVPVEAAVAAGQRECRRHRFHIERLFQEGPLIRLYA
jgi:hypothetical protein